MNDKELFVVYIHSNKKWYVWIYSYGKLIEKLEVFTSKLEAVKAVDQWKKGLKKHGDS